MPRIAAPRRHIYSLENLHRERLHSVGKVSLSISDAISSVEKTSVAVLALTETLANKNDELSTTRAELEALKVSYATLRDNSSATISTLVKENSIAHETISGLEIDLDNARQFAQSEGDRADIITAETAAFLDLFQSTVNECIDDEVFDTVVLNSSEHSEPWMDTSRSDEPRVRMTKPKDVHHSLGEATEICHAFSMSVGNLIEDARSVERSVFALTQSVRFLEESVPADYSVADRFIGLPKGCFFSLPDDSSPSDFIWVETDDILNNPGNYADQMSATPDRRWMNEIVSNYPPDYLSVQSVASR